jgi:hypothetical protein
MIVLLLCFMMKWCNVYEVVIFITGELNRYYRQVADKIPEWNHKFIVMPGEFSCNY